MKIEVLLLVIIASAAVMAAPAPPQYGILDGQCGRFFMGDECIECGLPKAWTPVGECPEGFDTVEVESVCTPRKHPYCCSYSHTGGEGDCSDLIINDELKRCAFVEDIHNCVSYPEDWHKGEVCPDGYDWDGEYIDCGLSSPWGIFIGLAILIILIIFFPRLQVRQKSE